MFGQGDGNTPLHVAAKSGNLDILQCLLAAGMDKDLATRYWDDAGSDDSQGGETKYHSTPLQVAAQYGRISVVRYLLGIGADKDLTRDPGGTTPLYRAARIGHLDVVDCLVAVGADKDKPATNGTMPLFAAAGNGQTSMVQYLLDHGSTSINKPDQTGCTPLHAAAIKGDIELTQALIQRGADPLLKEQGGKRYFELLPCGPRQLFLADAALTVDKVREHDYLLWFLMIQENPPSDDDNDLGAALAYGKVANVVETLLLTHLELAAAMDENGRVAMDVASKTMKAIMQKILLWHGQYRITEQRPEHESATCYVFKAVNEHVMDSETGKPMRVALKLMRQKAQFQRELGMRDKDFGHDFVMNVLQTHPAIGSTALLESMSDEVTDVEVDSATGQLTKVNAEKLFFVVIPLADRNLFTALKQERWAGQNMEEVRHVFVQLLRCVEHMHRKGVIHADLKPLNIVRTGAQWKHIDLDATCEIGCEQVGHKSSSAYVPPEAVFVDSVTGSAYVRSVVAVAKGKASYDLLTAHPSFDVWSLACILYQMCTPGVNKLFAPGDERDDNLTDDPTEEDNLVALAQWTRTVKERKLGRVADKRARNLLAQMLHKDPLMRPSLARVLMHPFLSGKKVARLVGDKPTYDVFLSYRVASDSQHAERLYNLLTSPPFSLTVYWDKLCLEKGVDWEQGFCAGLVSSRAFVPLLSRAAINHPEMDWQNFSKLAQSSACDNVFLEHRLAVELQGLGLVEKVFPLFIGDVDASTGEYGNYFAGGCHPLLRDVSVSSVEVKLLQHMESQALGTPLEPRRTVKSVVCLSGSLHTRSGRGSVYSGC